MRKRKTPKGKIRVQFRCSEGFGSKDILAPNFIKELKKRGLDPSEFHVDSGRNWYSVPSDYGWAPKQPEEIAQEAEDYDYVVHTFLTDAENHRRQIVGSRRPVVKSLGEASGPKKSKTGKGIFDSLIDEIIENHYS